MALSLAESAALMIDSDFRGRVKVAALKYATYMFMQGGNSVSRTAWAQRTMQQPDQAAAALVGPVVMNVNVQTLGPNIDDNNLGAAVQYTADMMI
ncbi:MAG: hypothetical protein C5B60_09175 [Chloroflexi bacterium]|nr:MAG: hypothetical protein C5B60_09175 [Chloroflexota bacterium]